MNDGYCPVCEDRVTFVAEGDWLRDTYVCTRCRSIPRQRALLAVLELIRPTWREMVIHESSPSADFIQRKCPRYSFSHYFPDIELGGTRNGILCQDLERLTFADATLDVFVTQDVLEHVFHPERALAEIMRCLKPGGLHVFTAPKHKGLKKSYRRAELRGGQVCYLLEPSYHGNPVGDGQSLVTWDYGADFEELAAKWGGYLVSTYVLRDRRIGIDGEYLEVFVQGREELNRTRIGRGDAQ